MQTPIQQLIEYLQIRNLGILEVLKQSNLSSYEIDRYNGICDINLQIIQELETEYIHKEKEHILTAFCFGNNLNYIKDSVDFYNELY